MNKLFALLVLMAMFLSISGYSQKSAPYAPSTIAKKVFLEFNKDSTEVRVRGALLGDVSDDPDAYVTNRQVKEAKGYGRLYVIRFADSGMGALAMTGLMYVYEGGGDARFLLPAPAEAEGYRIVIVNKGKGSLDVGRYMDAEGKFVALIAPGRKVEIVSDGKDWMDLR